MIRLAGIDHLVLRVADLEKMLHFYVDVLGCNVERETPRETGLYQLRAGKALIDLITLDGRLGLLGGRGPEKEGRNMDHFCLQVENFDPTTVRAYLIEKGCLVEPAQERYGATGSGLSLYLTDPEGNMVELRGT